MEIVTVLNNNVGKIMPKGRIDTTTSIDFEDKIQALVDKGIIKVIIDFSNTDFISSAGIRILLLKAKEIKILKGEIVLSNLPESIAEVFSASGFTILFSIYKTAEEATQAFSKK